jgi:pyridoxine 5-phosphate synthase
MTKLSVNLNKIALLRNQRNIGIPSVISAAKTVVRAGAYGVTVHPRPDQRHIRYNDVDELSELTAALKVEFNIEGNPFTGKYMEVVSRVKPDQATLVPDDPAANTSDHGWDLQANGSKLEPIVKELQELGIRVSVFMDPDVEAIQLAGEIGVDRVELYTEPYARAYRLNDNLEEVMEQYIAAAEAAAECELGVNAGHDLNLNNLKKFCKSVPNVLEVSIGHALIADALDMGLESAVKEYLKLLGD